MLIFFGGIILLVLSYFTYAKYIEKMFGMDPERKTPAYTLSDGVDYIPMATWRVYLIQLLNIAGLGPIYGAVQGALFGPIVFLWIIFGTILGGAVHDYLSGMISIRHNGASLSEIQGMYLGKTAQAIMRVFMMVLLVLVGVVFVSGPAQLLAAITPNTFFTFTVWSVIIFAYYFCATVLPIDVLIGNIYPVFGICLAIMALGIMIALPAEGYHIPSMVFKSLNPKGISAWPTMFITVACGAISGFHATQSPLMARCIKGEKQGRFVFYGAMVSEGIIAMVWAAAGLAFYKDVPGLNAMLTKAGPGGVVLEVCKTMLGTVGGILAILGVVVCPITSGDTAFRAGRLILADITKVDQKKATKRLLLAVPMFIVGIILTQVNFNVIWKYFAWANQTLAAVSLWAFSVYLIRNDKNHWVSTLPATFMTIMTTSYILQAKEGFRIPAAISNPVGIVLGLAVFALFIAKGKKYAKSLNITQGM